MYLLMVQKFINLKQKIIRKYFERLVCRQYEKQTRFTGYIYDFSVDYNAIAVDNIKDIHKYLMKKNVIYQIQIH